MTGTGIDLHTHSTASDGTVDPGELMGQAVQAGLRTVALTDHDTTGGWAQAAAARPDNLTLVRGIELSCASAGISLHLLGYLFDPDEAEFAETRARLRRSRVDRGERIARMLEDAGTGVTWERVREIAGGVVGRPHVAQALVEQGQVGSVSEAFTPEWIGNGGRFYAHKIEVDVLEGVRLVTGAGGVAVFAHPAAHKRGRTVGDDVIAAMAEAGLSGLEVDHVDHDDAARTHLTGLAAELGLFTTGSSDFHGSAKTVRLGAHTTRPDVLDQIVERATGVPLLDGAS